jgi:hypothetical protein
MTAFLDDDRLRAEIAPHMSRAAFLRAVNALEPYGFPKPDKLFKGRYWPAVLAWLDAQAGLGQAQPLAPDGPETWGDEHAVEDAGAAAQKAGGRGRALLARGGAVDGRRPPLPGGLDPFTQRRHARGN